MREVRSDLHIHTLLSACAEVEMIPPLIVEEALSKGLDLIAVTDHNTIGNARSVIQAAEKTDLTVLPGMELQTREEVELLCLFDTVDQAEVWQTRVDGWLLPLENDPERFGPQYLVDHDGDFIAEEPRLLQAPTSVGLEEAVRQVRALGGLAILAHIDRSYHGLMPVLGIWPEDLAADAAEVSSNLRPSEARRRFASLPADLPLVSFSDAHWLAWMAKVITIFKLSGAPTIAELRAALRGTDGRSTTVP